MPVQFVEGAVDALRDYFIANMGAKVAAINAELGGSLLTNPADWFLAERKLESLENLPTGYILAKTSPLVPRNFSNGIGIFSASHNIDIGIVDKVGTDDLDDLQRGVYRYIRAIVELLLEAEANALNGFNLDGPQTPLYSPTKTIGSFMYSGGLVSVVLAKEEVKDS